MEKVLVAIVALAIVFALYVAGALIFTSRNQRYPG